MVKLGDIIEIPLENGRKGYAQYVIRDPMGPMIQVLDFIQANRPELDAILGAHPLFPPIITGVFAAIRSGFWTKIGNREPIINQHPGFISTLYDQKRGEAGIWYFWNGEKSIRLGEKLPEEYKDKEFLMVWDPHDVVHRIETGEYLFPYRDLILHNKFTPRNG